MSFTRLESRLANLPIILAGPILRRVEKNNVTVWFASKQTLSNVILEVRNTSGRTILRSNASNTVTLGKNLHVLAITATSSGELLTRGFTYLYDFSFTSLGGQSLSSPGVVASSDSEFRTRFCYAPFNLPSFRLPSEVPQLKIVQGSCRKPHGGQTDAFRGLDTMLEAHANDVQRPEMLILTGDQIYADDVADALLYMLMDASNTLLKWGVGPSYVQESLPRSPTEAQLKPGNRQNLVAPHPDESRVNQFSSGYAKSHLITLGEFYVMYLFAWSPNLWPDDIDSVPDYDVVWTGRDRTFRPSTTPPRFRIVEAEEVNTKHYETFRLERISLQQFSRSMTFVRRALANIPTYMIFDDHEITDDWFLTREWVNNTLGSRTLTRRIIQNGLAAYAVFQAWGNRPNTFQSGDGRDLLNLLSDLEANPGNQTTIFNQIGDKILPQLQSSGRVLSGSRIPWHYNIEYDDFRLVVIDTRTQRGYPSDAGSPALLSGPAISNQLTNRDQSKQVTILVSPAPVFGDINIEALQQLKGVFMGAYAADQEAWGFNHAAFETFLHHIASYGKIVCLSGDVHYSFSASVKYWNDRGTGIPRAAMAQLCSSSLKNSTEQTNAAASWFLIPTSASVKYITWPTSGRHYEIVEDSRFARRRVRANEPIRWDRTIEARNGRVRSGAEHQPQSRYQLDYARDRRSQSARPGAIPSRGGGTTAQQRAGYVHRSRAENGHRTVVGQDTISVVTFDWPQQKVIHTLWFVPEGLTSGATNRTLLQAYTVHQVPLVIPTSTDPRPGD